MTASIVTHRTPLPQLRQAVECILRADPDRIYVVDNSPDRRLAAIAADYPGVDYRHVENRGFGAGHNIAIREAMAGDPDGCHLVMNADVWWDGDTLTPLVAQLSQRPDVGLIAPRATYPDGTPQYNRRMLPTPLDLLARRFLPPFLSRRRMRRYLLADADPGREIDCPYILGCFMLFRNRALKDCGIFDERFFMYPEDIDITRRMHRRWRTLWWPGATVVHAHAAESRRKPRMLMVHLVNMARYFNKWGWISDSERRAMNTRLLEETAGKRTESEP